VPTPASGLWEDSFLKGEFEAPKVGLPNKFREFHFLVYFHLLIFRHLGKLEALKSGSSSVNSKTLVLHSSLQMAQKFKLVNQMKVRQIFKF